MNQDNGNCVSVELTHRIIREKLILKSERSFII